MTLPDHLASIVQAGVHWDRAAEAMIARDDEAFAREMQEFKRIEATWGDCLRTVATREPSHQSTLPSRPFGRVSNYREENKRGE